MKVTSNRLKDIERHYVAQLALLFGKEASQQMMRMLIKHLFDIDRIRLALEPDIRLSESELLEIHFAVKKLLQHEPIQYITGEVEFCGNTFIVTPDVLIPRPETEEFVLQIKKSFPAKPNCTIWDIGTGSGCIAISLALLIPESIVTGFDVSEKALQIARSNVEKLGTKVLFAQADVLSVVFPETAQADLIVSNPPYIRESEKQLMQKNVLDYEPALALFVDDNDPLIFYRKITELAARHLNKGGMLYFEINEVFGAEVKQLCENVSLTNVQILKDYKGKERFVSCQKK
ncbi:MAG: peptide chain release factor N(5)-glutamine methyltransferase [Lentimicrobiaceae bacterium]|nr:peptide chain release factor N(5)-glutamine methyltransferase [Lentimicrobiaceae bacterium]